MKERPIIFSGPMVRAILAGRKTQTRRVMKPQPQPNGIWSKSLGDFLCLIDEYPPSANIWNGAWLGADAGELNCCPYGVPGDRLWVRETWRVPNGAPLGWVDYKADEERAGFLWCPSIHLPRWASRLTLEVKFVRVERVQEISEADAKAEGRSLSMDDAAGYFPHTWDSINAKRGYGWDENPWVWVIGFEVLSEAREGRE